MPDYKTKLERLEPIMLGFVYRQQITIIAGAPFAGKTTCIYNKIAMPLATGKEDLLGGIRPPIKILICSERDWKFNSEQLINFGISSLPKNIHLFCQPDLPKHEEPEFFLDPLAYVAKTVFTESFTPDLVILDTYQVFQPVRNSTSINDYAAARKDMAYIKKWADQYNLGVVANFHAPKQNAKNLYEDPFQRIIGSTAYRASVIGTAFLERCSDGFARMYFESHVASLSSPRYFRYGDFAEVEDSIALAEHKEGEEAKYLTMSDRETEYFNRVPDEPLSYTETNKRICSELGIELNNGRNIANRLQSKGLVIVDLQPESREKFIKKSRPS